MTSEDWPSVAKIYAEGIATGFATFESRIPDFTDWDQVHAKACRIIAENDNTLVGWAALSPVSSRCVYSGVAEVSVYVASQSRGQGVGKSLMKQLVEESEKAGYWTLQSGIFPENEASIKLHEQVGFRLLGVRKRIGKTANGLWKDNLVFEKRSTIVGV